MTSKIMDFNEMSVPERLQLVEDLWDSIEDEHVPIPAWHLEELERRLADFQANPDTGIPWEVVREKLYKLIR